MQRFSVGYGRSGYSTKKMQDDKIPVRACFHVLDILEHLITTVVAVTFSPELVYGTICILIEAVNKL